MGGVEKYLAKEGRFKVIPKLMKLGIQLHTVLHRR